jgi:hypothetical protein
MDVSNLIPTPTTTSASGAAAARARSDRVPFDAAAVHAPTPEAPATARPVLGSAHVTDRVERSPELQRALAELKLEMTRTSDGAPDQVVALRQQVASGSLAANGSFEAAALRLLHGEPFVAS